MGLLKEGDHIRKDFSTVLTTIDSQKLLKQLLRQLHQQQNLQLDEVIHLFQEVNQEINIPLSVFSGKLYPAEALCKYLKEKENLSYSEMGKLLHRDNKNIWATYQRAKKKMKKPKRSFLKKEEKYFLPLSLFANLSLSLLENLVLYLHQTYSLTNPQIAKLLHKSPPSMAVLYKRAREKSKEESKS